MTTPTLFPPAVVRASLAGAKTAAERRYKSALLALVHTRCCQDCARRNLETANARLAEWEEAQRVLADWDAEAMRAEQMRLFERMEVA